MTDQLSVLVIDDDPGIVLTLKAYLDDCGYIVHVAGDGAEGVEVYMRVRPDVVVTDLRMPKLDGFEVIHEIKVVSPDAAIIVLTGTGEQISDHAAELGASGCLYKPLNKLNDLVVAIESAYERKGKGS